MAFLYGDIFGVIVTLAALAGAYYVYDRFLKGKVIK